MASDVFDLQDRIPASVVGAIEPTMRKAEIERAHRKPVENLDAYDLYLRALPHVYAMRPDENLLGSAFFSAPPIMRPSQMRKSLRRRWFGALRPRRLILRSVRPAT